MVNLPKISIIIPVYNVVEYIEQCLQSIMRQTYIGEMECILVDDCGSDNSVGVAQKLISEYKGCIVFSILHHERNRGLSAARNTGTDYATGDYIYYLDSDDYIAEDCIESLATPLLEKDYDIVIGDYKMMGDHPYPAKLNELNNEIEGNDAIFTSYANRNLYEMAWNKLCNLKFLRNNAIQFLEGQLHEDVLWTYNTMLSVQSIRIVHKEVYYYRVRANSITTNIAQVHKRLLSYGDTLDYMHHHPHPLTKAYHQRLLDCWKSYLTIALKNHISFFHQYVYLRRSCPYKQMRYIMKGQMSMKQIKANLSFILSPTIGYCYLKVRNYYLEKKHEYTLRK